MYSFDITDFRAEFVKHLYNFEPDVFDRNDPDPLLVPEDSDASISLSQDTHLNFLVTGESDPLPSYRTQHLEPYPLLNEALSRFPYPMSKGDSCAPPACDRQYTTLENTTASKAVPIAPMHSDSVVKKLGTVEGTAYELPDRSSEMELRALRAYRRKIRNRESAARSNLARKRRRELQRIELMKKQRSYQGELAPAVS